LNRKHVAFAVIVFAVLLGAVAVSTSGEDETEGGRSRDTAQTLPETSEPSEEPTFVASGSSNIYVIDVATRAVEQVTSNDDQQIATTPDWSATGDIVFIGAPGADELTSLFVIKPDGSGRRRVPTRVRHLFWPTWAPDGHAIAFVRLGYGLYVIDVRTKTARRLEATSSADDAPAWSPDGNSILFQRQMPNPSNLELYLVDPAGNRLRRLTHDPPQQITPTWSPDGSRVAFAEQQNNGQWVISTMRLDGSDRKLVTDREVSSQDPAWSPDGRKIAFVLQQAERHSIAVIDADGGKALTITPKELVEAASPVWSPDGKKIAFAARQASRPPPSRAPAP
jgi:Tol biopolymer transport system component